MDTSPSHVSPPRTTPPRISPPGTTAPENLAQTGPASSGSLGAELRESLLLLSCAVTVTVGLTAVAQAALALLA